MDAYPMSVRKRIIEMYKAGDSTDEIAAVFGYSPAGVRRVKQRLEETGSLEPLTGKEGHKPGRKPSFDAETRERLKAEVAKQSDATLAELRERVGVKADLAVYCRELQKLGLSRKKSRSTPTSRSVRT